MSEYASVRPDFLSIPAPRYKLGDYVKWNLEFEDDRLEFFGIVGCICWAKELEDKQGSWDYITRCLWVRHNGKTKPSCDCDQVLESELKAWNGDGIDTKIDTGIDSGIASPTTNKPSKASLL